MRLTDVLFENNFAGVEGDAILNLGNLSLVGTTLRGNNAWVGLLARPRESLN